MGKYFQVYKTKLQGSLEYRFDFLFGNFTHFLPLAAVLVLWSAVYRGKQEIAGYTYAQMLTYFVVARAVQSLQWAGFQDDVEKDIKDGLLSKYLLKPISYMGYRLALLLGEKSLNLFVDLGFLCLITWFCRANFAFQTNGFRLCLFGLSLFFGLLIN